MGVLPDPDEGPGEGPDEGWGDGAGLASGHATDCLNVPVRVSPLNVTWLTLSCRISLTTVE